MLRIAPLALLAVVLACGTTSGALGPSGPIDIDRETCESEGRLAVVHYSNSLTLVAALPTTAAAAAHWEYTRHGPNGPRPGVSRWADLPAAHRVVFCYFEGDFANYSPPGAGQRPFTLERALVYVTDGRGAWLDHIGSKTTTPLTAP